MPENGAPAPVQSGGSGSETLTTEVSYILPSLQSQLRQAENTGTSAHGKHRTTVKNVFD